MKVYSCCGVLRSLGVANSGSFWAGRRIEALSRSGGLELVRCGKVSPGGFLACLR